MKSQEKSSTSQRDLHLSKIQAKPIKYTEYAGLRKVSGPPEPTTSCPELRKQVYDHLNKLSEMSRINEALPSLQANKQKTFVRRIMPRKNSSRQRLKYDEDDYRAMQRMQKLRVDWYPHEINMLLVCKIASTYLSPNPRKQMVSFLAVRDVLRMHSRKPDYKTSRACQRRLMYMLRQPCTVKSIALGIEEIKQDPFVTKRYGGIMERLKSECTSSAEYEKRTTEVFKELVDYIRTKYYDIAEVKPNKHAMMPKTVQEFNLFFKLIHPTTPQHSQGFTKDVRNTNDIHLAIVNSIIHSSMCCGKDRRAWSYQLYKVYEQYPEIVLRQALSKSRLDQMVTIKKNHLSTIKKYGNYMPMSSSQFQLSFHYIYKFQTKWPYDIFKQSYDVFIKLLQWYSERKNVTPAEQEDSFNGTEILPSSSGIVTVIHDLLAHDRIDFDIEMPEQIIMLDSRFQDKNETYFRVAQRYQDILTRLYRFKFENAAAQNAEPCELSEMKTGDEQAKVSLKRKKSTDEIGHHEEPIPKISRTVEECDKRGREEERSSQDRESKVITKRNSIEKDESIESGEFVLKERSATQEQNEKQNCFTNHSSRKRSADTEEDSDGEQTASKKPRLNSEHPIDLLDTEEFEEFSLCEDLEKFEKAMVTEYFKPVKEELKEEGTLHFYNRLRYRLSKNSDVRKHYRVIKFRENI